jgi:hypothetical protein
MEFGSSQGSEGIQEVAIEAVVIRCGCGDPDSHNGRRGPATTCPLPRAVEQRGTVSYWHKSWWRRTWFKLFGRPA